MKRLLIFIACILTISGIAADAAATDRLVTDMAGRSVAVPEKAMRLVTTFKPAALCVTSLGLQHLLVGIDTDSKKDRLQLAVNPAVAQLPAVGRKSTGLNFEAILSVKPDLVIMYAQKDGIAVADRLKAHGVAAIVILPEKMESLYRTMRLIAGAAGVPENAERAVSACEKLVEMAGSRVVSIPKDQRKTVYFASSRGTFSTATGDLLQDQLITLAGGIHAGHDLKGYFREISPEKFISWNPDLVVVSGAAAGKVKKRLNQPQFAGVTAVADGRIYPFPSNIAPWDFPSPLSAAGVLWLSVTCYPERFADIDLLKELEGFHQTLFGKGFAALGGKLAD